MRLFPLVTLLLFIASGVAHAQYALSAEGLIAYPTNFKKEEVGVTKVHFQKGVRFTAYYEKYGDELFSIAGGLRFTHHFETIDSVSVDAYDQNYDHLMLNGSGKMTYGSLLPQFSIKFKSNRNLLLSYRYNFGVGATWAKYLYEFPGFDSLTMTYYNPPWNATGKYNAERKLVAVRPCFLINLAVQYEFRYFYVYENIDYTYCTGDFPPSPISLGAGILVPIPLKD